MVTVNGPFIIATAIIILIAAARWLEWYLSQNETIHKVRREKDRETVKKDGAIKKFGKGLKELFVFGKADLKRPWYMGVPAGLLVLLNHFISRSLQNDWLILSVLAPVLVLMVVFDIVVMLRVNREFFSVGDRRKRYLKTQTAQGILVVVLGLGVLGAFYFSISMNAKDTEGLRESVDWVIEPVFDGGWPEFSEGLAAVGNTGEMGYIDKSGDIVIPLQYNRAFDFREGLAAVQKDWRWGYIDAHGNVVIPFQYDEANDFGGGLAPVRKDGKWCVIDRQGKVLLETDYQYISTFREGVAEISVKDKEHSAVEHENLIDSSGNLLFKREYGNFGPIGEGFIFAWDKEGGKGYFLDRNEKRVIPQGFAETTGFSGGVAGVMLDSGEYALIDREGNTVKKLTEDGYYDLQACKEGLVMLNNTSDTRARYFTDDDVRYGFKDLYGNVVVPVVFRDVSFPGEGLIGIEVDGRWGFIENPLPAAARGINPELWAADRTQIGTVEGVPVYAGELESRAFSISPEMQGQARIPILKQAFEELKIEKAFEKYGRNMEPDEIRYQVGHAYYKKLLLESN